MAQSLMSCTDCREVLWDCEYCGEDFENEDEIVCKLDEKETVIHRHKGCENES